MPKPGQSDGLAQVLRYSQIGFILPASTVVGWLLGAALDHWLKTTWLYLVGLIVGIVAGFVELIRVFLKSEKEIDESEKEEKEKRS